jgi:hypothetical protein
MTTEATPGALGSNDQLGAWQPIEAAPAPSSRSKPEPAGVRLT